MALPSAVTIGSLALVAAAGVGLVAVASDANDNAGHQEQTVSGSPDSTGTQATTSSPSSGSSTPSSTSTSTEERPGRPKGTLGTHPQRPDPVPKVFVEVYNNSGVSGLAAETAQVLERAGWNVAATDNWYGNIPANTVYYPDALHSQAKKLAKVLHITRIRPAVSPMQFDRLTVILVRP